MICVHHLLVYILVITRYPFKKPLESQILRTKEIWNNMDIGLCGPFVDSL